MFRPHIRSCNKVNKWTQFGTFYCALVHIAALFTSCMMTVSRRNFTWNSIHQLIWLIILAGITLLELLHRSQSNCSWNSCDVVQYVKSPLCGWLHWSNQFSSSVGLQISNSIDSTAPIKLIDIRWLPRWSWAAATRMLLDVYAHHSQSHSMIFKFHLDIECIEREANFSMKNISAQHVNTRPRHLVLWSVNNSNQLIFVYASKFPIHFISNWIIFECGCRAFNEPDAWWIIEKSEKPSNERFLVRRQNDFALFIVSTWWEEPFKASARHKVRNPHQRHLATSDNETPEWAERISSDVIKNSWALLPRVTQFNNLATASIKFFTINWVPVSAAHIE